MTRSRLISIQETLQSLLSTTFLPNHSRYISRVDFSLRQVTARSHTLLYVTFYVSAYPATWDEFNALPLEGGLSLKIKAEMELRRLALSVKAFDVSRLDCGGEEREGMMLNWMFSERPSQGEYLELPVFERLEGMEGMESQRAR